jgi:hypothetical protein
MGGRDGVVIESDNTGGEFCVVKMDNPQSPVHEGMPTRVRLIGPFATGAEASNWAMNPANNPHDNPCWQVVCLAGDALSGIALVDPAA